MASRDVQPRERGTDAGDVRDADVRLDGVEYNPGKRWQREMDKWAGAFRNAKNPDTQTIMADREELEETMRDCLRLHHGYITAGIFARASGLTLYSARKQLNAWTQGDNPKLLMTPRGKEYIYTEI